MIETKLDKQVKPAFMTMNCPTCGSVMVFKRIQGSTEFSCSRGHVYSLRGPGERHCEPTISDPCQTPQLPNAA